jgi:hypothetical protein
MHRTKLQQISDRINRISHTLEFVLISDDTRERLMQELKQLCKQRENYIETLGDDR